MRECGWHILYIHIYRQYIYLHCTYCICVFILYTIQYIYFIYEHKSRPPGVGSCYCQRQIVYSEQYTQYNTHWYNNNNNNNACTVLNVLVFALYLTFMLDSCEETQNNLNLSFKTIQPVTTKADARDSVQYRYMYIVQ